GWSCELIKDLRTSAFERSDPRPPRAQTRDRIPSKAWARKMAAPTRPITAVIISNIAKSPSRPCEQKRMPRLHSQKDSPGLTHNRNRPRILRNTCFKAGQLFGPPERSSEGATLDSPSNAPPHFRRDPIAIS